MKNTLCAVRRMLLVVCVPLFLCGPVAGASKKKNDTVKLPVSKKAKTYFSAIDPEVLLLVENGSPESLARATAAIRKSESEYSDSEKVLIGLSAEIMKIVWPSQKITWEVFSYPEDNAYIGAVNSARAGVFDSSTGNVDFLTTVLPALVALTVQNPSDALLNSSEYAVLSGLEQNGDSVLGNYLLGRIYEKKGNLPAAETYLARAYNGSAVNVDLSLSYAQVLQKNQNLGLAEAVLAQVSGQNTTDLKILKSNAYIAFSKKDYAAAEEYVAKVLQQTPNDLEFVLFRAKILVEKNDYIHAVSLLDMYARQENSSLDYLLLRARVQLDWSKNTAAATETVEKALQLYPDNPDALMFAARISSMTDAPVAGKYADELSQKVLELDPENTDARIYALDGLILRENWSEAYKISSELVRLDPSPELVMRHVKVCLAVGRRGEALEQANAAYKANPADETVIQLYVLAYSQAASRDEALSLINRLLGTAPSKLKSYLYFRRSYLQQTEDNMLADLRSSLIANPRNSDALFRLYEVYFAKQDYRKAQYYLRQVVAINPNDSSVKKLNEALTKLIQ